MYDGSLLDAGAGCLTLALDLSLIHICIGIPFTLAAVLTGYVYLWLVWGA